MASSIGLLDDWQLHETIANDSLRRDRDSLEEYHADGRETANLCAIRLNTRRWAGLVARNLLLYQCPNGRIRRVQNSISDRNKLKHVRTHLLEESGPHQFWHVRRDRTIASTAPISAKETTRITPILRPYDHAHTFAIC